MANHDKNMALRHAREKRYRQSKKGRRKRNLAQKKRRRANPQKAVDWRLKKYGITQADYDRMVEEQAGVCAICLRDPKNSQHKKLRIDHCHWTGKVRGLICHQCNVAIGNFGDCIPVMRNAIQYLLESGSNENGLPPCN